MCHHYDREQLTTTEPIGAEDVDEESDEHCSDGNRSSEDDREVEDPRADAPPAADD